MRYYYMFVKHQVALNILHAKIIYTYCIILIIIYTYYYNYLHFFNIIYK